MRRHHYLLLILLVALILSSCAGNSYKSNAARLHRELAKWENWGSKGIIQANYMGFSLRKFYIAQKQGSEMRLDVVDGGVLGAGASPLLSAYIGPYIAIQSPMMPQLEMLDLESMFPTQSFQAFSNLDSLATIYEEQIISTKEIQIDSVKVSFTDKMQLADIKDLVSGVQISMTYSRRGDLDFIDIDLEDGASLKLLVSQMIYAPQQIEALPRPSFSTGDLLRMFNEQLQNLPEAPNP